MSRIRPDDDVAYLTGVAFRWAGDDNQPLPVGVVRNVPRVGERVLLLDCEPSQWRVIDVDWIAPLAEQGAMTPRQSVNVWVVPEERAA